MSQERIEQTFEVESPARLKLNNIRGSVDIRAGEEGMIAVTAVRHLASGNDAQTEVVIEQAEDGQVIVKTDYQNSISNWFGLNKPCKVDYVVRVPRECDIRAGGVSCGIFVQGVRGEINIHSVSGSLKVNELSGQLKLGMVSGSIQAEKLQGKLDANSVSGRIRIRESQIAEATVKTVSGSVVLQTPLADGPYAFKAVSGSVCLVVPEDTGCVAAHKSVSGRLRTSLPVTKDERHGSRGWAEIQGGGPEVACKSVSGSFRIVTSEDEKIVERRNPTEPAPQPKNQMEILRKIERGEVSVEDALEELNA